MATPPNPCERGRSVETAVTRGPGRPICRRRWRKQTSGSERVAGAPRTSRQVTGSASGRRDDTRYWVGPATSKMGKDVSPGSGAGSRLPGGSLCLPVGSRRGRGSNGRDTERCTARRRSRGGRGAEERARRRGVPEALQGEGCCPRSTHRGQAVWSRSTLASDRGGWGLRRAAPASRGARRAARAPRALALAQGTAQGKPWSRRPEGPAGPRRGR